MDPRYTALANQLVSYSLKVKKSERVMIDVIDTPDAFTLELIRAVRKRGAHPFVQTQHSQIIRESLLLGSKDQFTHQGTLELHKIKSMDCYIAVRGANNIFETSDVPPAQIALATSALKKAWNHRVQKTRWVVLRWPSPSMAQLSQMSTPAFEKIFFDVCTMDYKKLKPGAAALKKLMDKTDQVHIKAPGVNLHFSIKNIPTVTCTGEFNIPDGEVFTAPVKNSVQGHIEYNAPTVYQGVSFDNIRFEFKDGKIINATASNTKRLNQILDTDPGARYIGEFALAFNPHIKEPMRDILFDEKIAGSFHFTPGQAYEDADNGNRSKIHWDIVSIQRPDYGGGEIYFDNKLIRKNGKFLPKSLQTLN